MPAQADRRLSPPVRTIVIQKSPTADTRTCDPSTVTLDDLLASSKQHIRDVQEALQLFASLLGHALVNHDRDKLSDIAWFHADFVTGFKQTGWWDRHRRINRHHLNHPDGIPEDVNLVDVLDYVSDCVMAGMARAGSVYDIALPDEVLRRAFSNTVDLLKGCVVVEED